MWWDRSQSEEGAVLNVVRPDLGPCLVCLDGFTAVSGVTKVTPYIDLGY
jgi:hypothetical protein